MQDAFHELHVGSSSEQESSTSLFSADTLSLDAPVAQIPSDRVEASAEDPEILKLLEMVSKRNPEGRAKVGNAGLRNNTQNQTQIPENKNEPALPPPIRYPRRSGKPKIA